MPRTIKARACSDLVVATGVWVFMPDGYGIQSIQANEIRHTRTRGEFKNRKLGSIGGEVELSS
jgi:hypothetical protein